MEQSYPATVEYASIGGRTLIENNGEIIRDNLRCPRVGVAGLLLALQDRSRKSRACCGDRKCEGSEGLVTVVRVETGA